MVSATEMASVMKRVFASLDRGGTGRIHRDGLDSILTQLVGLTPAEAKNMLDDFCQGRSFVEYARFFDFCAGVDVEADEVMDWTFSKWLRAPKIAEIIAGSVFESLGPGSDLDAARKLARELTGASELHLMLQASTMLEKLADYLYDQLQALVGSVAVNVDEYNGKFNGFDLAFGDMSKFHKGLDDVVGLPSSKLREAMQHEHCGCDDSKATFETSNYGIKTTSETEWHFVVSPDQWQGPGPWPHEEEHKLAREKWRSAPESFHLDAVIATLNGELEQQSLTPLVEEEGMGARLYTGPMFMKYNAVLRGKGSRIVVLNNAFRDLCKGNEYTSTLHVINSCLIKLSGLTKVERVYRGMSGGKLPEQFTKRDKFKARGGVEAAFMSTTLDRSVAMHYAASAGSQAGVVIEMQQGLTDRGADLSRLSQYPHEREICFPPLCGIQLLDTRVEDGVVVAITRASVNMKAMTIDKVLGQRRQLLVDVMQNETRVLLRDLKSKAVDAGTQALVERICRGVSGDLTALPPDDCSDTRFFKDKFDEVFTITSTLREALVEGSSDPRCVALKKLFPLWEQVVTTSDDCFSIHTDIFGNSEMLARQMVAAFPGTHVKFYNGIGDCGKALQYFPMLQHLVLRGNSRVLDWLEALPRLSSLSSLQHLDIGHNCIGAEGAAKLAEALPRLSSLQHLNIKNIGAEGAAELAKALPLLSSLQHFDIGHNFIGAEGAAELAKDFVDEAANQGPVKMEDILKVSSASTCHTIEVNSDSDEPDEDKAEVFTEWQRRSMRIRYSLDMPPEAAPWTPTHALKGVSRVPRHLDVIDVAFWAWMRSVGMTMAQVQAQQNLKPNWYCDVTQNADRRPWGDRPDTETKRSRTYAFHLDRVLDAEDCLDLLGWHGSAQCLGMSNNALHSLSGEAIHLAPFSALLAAIFAVPSASWWVEPRECPTAQSGASSSSQQPSEAQGVPQKKRRTGGLKISRSLT